MSTLVEHDLDPDGSVVDQVAQVGSNGEVPVEQGHRPRRGSSSKQVLITAAVLALLVGASLVLLMTVTGGEEVGADAADVTVLSQTEVTEALLRASTGTNDIELELLYSPEWYFSWSGRDLPTTDGSPTLAFFMFETIHLGDLPSDLPGLVVTSSTGSSAPAEIIEISDSEHHRVSQLLFPAETTDGTPIVGDGEPLRVVASWDDGTVTEVEWVQPMPFGLGVLNTTDTSTTYQMPALSLGAIAAIMSGMLAALTPCLLLLATYYTAVLSATAAASADQAIAERRLLATGMFFVGGFTAVYTAGGVIAGFIGESVSRSDSVTGYARPMSVVAGVMVVLMGIRMASQARVPVVCKLPGFNRPTRTGWAGSAVMGSTFAIGCLSCFSATVLTALLLYAGATGSPIVGGLVMLMFSAGVGVMFLLAAVLVARAAPLATWLTKAQPVIGTLSAVVMIVLGVLMVTYQYHSVTGYLFELWN